MKKIWAWLAKWWIGPEPKTKGQTDDFWWGKQW